MSTRCASIAKALGEYPGGSSLSAERGGGRRLAGRSAYAGAAHIYMSPGGCTIYLRFGSGSLGNPGDFLDSERASRLAGGFGMDILLDSVKGGYAYMFVPERRASVKKTIALSSA